MASVTRLSVRRTDWFRYLRLAMWMVLPLLASPVASTDSDPEVFPAPVTFILHMPNGTSMPALYLAQFFSQPNEDKIAFLRRVGRFLESYAAREGFEACGEIWRDNSDMAWVVPVITLRSHIMCRSTSLAPSVAGLSPWLISGETIHVHPGLTVFQINEVDAGFNKHLRIGEMQAIEPDHFSKGDLHLGPGYLVAAGHLQYQRDHGKVMRDFGPLNP